MTTPEGLAPALAAARGMNTHSIVEVVTARGRNVAHHRSIQEAVRQAVLQALADRVGMLPFMLKKKCGFHIWSRICWDLRRISEMPFN